MFGALLLESSSKIIHKKRKTLNSIDKNKQLTLTHEVFRQNRKKERGSEKKAVFERARPAGVCSREGGKITQNYFFRTTETSERAADAAQNSHTRS